MFRWPRAAIWLSALAIGAVQLVGSFGAAENQPDRKGIDALAVVLILLGPASLAVRDRWPLLAVAVTLSSTVAYLGAGYPYGPISFSVVVALGYAVLAGRRRETWALSAIAYVGSIVAAFVDPRLDDDGGLLVRAALVAAWLIVILAVAEVVRTRRDTFRERARAEE